MVSTAVHTLVGHDDRQLPRAAEQVVQQAMNVLPLSCSGLSAMPPIYHWV